MLFTFYDAIFSQNTTNTVQVDTAELLTNMPYVNIYKGQNVQEFTFKLFMKKAV